MKFHRGSGDMLRWITRFQLSVQRMQEVWNKTYPCLPITDLNSAEVRAFAAGLPAEEQEGLTNEENYMWFQKRFQGRKMKRGFKGPRKGKGKGRKGSGGRRFFKKKKGTTDA